MDGEGPGRPPGQAPGGHGEDAEDDEEAEVEGQVEGQVEDPVDCAAPFSIHDRLPHEPHEQGPSSQPTDKVTSA
jgi:hypothetical protein